MPCSRRFLYSSGCEKGFCNLGVFGVYGFRGFGSRDVVIRVLEAQAFIT